MKHYLVPLVAILAITTIIVVCIFNDRDGAIVGGGVTVIAGLGGYQVKVLRDKLSKK